MEGLARKFHEKGLFEGEQDVAGAGLDSESANDPHYNTAPEIDPLMTLRQVAQPNQDSANQPSATAEQAQAAEKRTQLRANDAMGNGALGAGDKGGAERMKAAQEKIGEIAKEDAKLAKQMSGGQAETPSAKGSFKNAAVGQGLDMAAAMGVGAVAGPVAAGATVVASASYNVLKAFMGVDQGSSSFKSSADSTGYVSSSASTQPTAPVSMASMQGMMNLPGDGKPLDMGRVNLASDGLCGIEKFPPLNQSPAIDSACRAFDNGLHAALSRGEENNKDAKPDLKVAGWKPTPPGNPGVFMPTPAGVV